MDSGQFAREAAASTAWSAVQPVESPSLCCDLQADGDVWCAAPHGQTDLPLEPGHPLPLLQEVGPHTPPARLPPLRVHALPHQGKV